MPNRIGVAAPTKPSQLSIILRAVAMLSLTFPLLSALGDYTKASSIGSDPKLIYVVIGASVIAFLPQLPYVFYKLPKEGKIAATLLLLAPMILAQVEVNQMDPTWEASPAGKREAADRAAGRRQQDEQSAREAQKAKGEKEAADQRELAEKQEALDAQKPRPLQVARQPSGRRRQGAGDQ